MLTVKEARDLAIANCEEFKIGLKEVEEHIKFAAGRGLFEVKVPIGKQWRGYECVISTYCSDVFGFLSNVGQDELYFEWYRIK